MPVVDTSVLLCGLSFPQSYSARFLRRTPSSVVISNKILAEALSVAGRKAPHLVVPILEYCKHVRSVNLDTSDIDRVAALTGGHEDDHLLAAALKGQENVIYSLDLGLFKRKMYQAARHLNLHIQFPSFEAYADNPLHNIVDLPSHSRNGDLTEGSITMFVTPSWSSQERRHIKKRWYAMDAAGLFAVWYETEKQRFQFLPYPLGSSQTQSIPYSFNERQHIRLTVTYHTSKGFSFYVDMKEAHCRRPWRPLVPRTRVYIGSSSEVSDHFNALFSGMRIFGRFLNQRIVRLMHEYNLLSVTDKDLEIVETNRWLLGP